MPSSRSVLQWHIIRVFYNMHSTVAIYNLNGTWWLGSCEEQNQKALSAPSRWSFPANCRGNENIPFQAQRIFLRNLWFYSLPGLTKQDFRQWNAFSCKQQNLAKAETSMIFTECKSLKCLSIINYSWLLFSQTSCCQIEDRRQQGNPSQLLSSSICSYTPYHFSP